MKVLGIDPGTGRLGWAIVEKHGSKEELIACDCIETPANTPLSVRLENIFNHLQQIIAEHKPDSAAVEELFFAKNVKTALSVGHARGVVLLCLQQAGVEINDYKPAEIKLAVTGYGNADKKMVQSMVKTILGLKEMIKPDDAADAVAVALTHLAMGKFRALAR
jgi:crossover junction endodeoxyribonuclease RuvC